jgi:hypothetical protein
MLASVPLSWLRRRKERYHYTHQAAALREKNCCLLAGVAEERQEIGEKPEMQHKHRLAQHNCVNRRRREHRHAERSFIPL